MAEIMHLGNELIGVFSEGRTESLYHLQTVPFETYVLNYVPASTIGDFRARRETKNPHPKVRKKSINTRKIGNLTTPDFWSE